MEKKNRHVKLPKSISRWLPHYGLLKQKEWEYLGVEQEAQWEHYMVHGMYKILYIIFLTDKLGKEYKLTKSCEKKLAPEPHILLFRREFKGVEEQLKNEERQVS